MTVEDAFGEAFARCASVNPDGRVGSLTDGFSRIVLADLGGVELLGEWQPVVGWTLNRSVVVPEEPDGVYERVRTYLEGPNPWVRRIEHDLGHVFEVVNPVHEDNRVLTMIDDVPIAVRRAAAVLVVGVDLLLPICDTPRVYVRYFRERFPNLFSLRNTSDAIDLIGMLLNGRYDDRDAFDRWYMDLHREFLKATYGRYARVTSTS